MAFSEIDKFPAAVLRHHYPAVPNHGDMTRFQEWPDAALDLLVGGTPCQSFSVAGLRKGLADPRGNLMLTYLAIADRYRPKWLVWENVPGALSSNGGRDFGAFLGAMAKLGYGFAYRVLDAQYFGLAQRRQRVFVVGHLGDWRRAAAVLFERESLSGHPAPRREAGQGTAYDTAPSLTASGRGVERTGESRGQDRVIAFSVKDHGADAGDIAPTLRAGGFTNSHANGGCMPAIAFDARQSDVIQYGNMSGPLDTDGHTIAVAFAHQAGGDGTSSGAFSTEMSPTLQKAQTMAVQRGMQVRRLTPRECERLQGFPDDYTLIPYNGKPAKDGPRYKALGNSMAVPCMAWIGRRVQLVEDLVTEGGESVTKAA